MASTNPIGFNNQPRYRVKFFNPKRGGVWSRIFATRADAEAFAVGKRLYAAPARVETLAAEKVSP
jgi:hypothetical protein